MADNIPSSQASTSQGVSRPSVINPLTMFCKINKSFLHFTGYFTRNNYKSISSFLESDGCLKFIEAFPDDELAGQLIECLEEYQSTNSTDLPSLSDRIPSSDHSAMSSSLSNLFQPSPPNSPRRELPPQDSSMSSQLSSAPGPLSMFSVDTLAPPPFISYGHFSIGQFTFPRMPEQFLQLDPNATEFEDTDEDENTERRTISLRELGSIFRSVGHLIWNELSKGFPMSIPEYVIQDVCAVFTFKFSGVNDFYKSIYSNLLTEGLNPQYIDIGKFLKSKIHSLKKNEAGKKKSEGKWTYRPGQEYLAAVKKASIDQKRQLGRLSSSKDRLAETLNELKLLKEQTRRRDEEIRQEMEELKENIRLEAARSRTTIEKVESGDSSANEESSEDETEERWRLAIKTRSSTLESAKIGDKSRSKAPRGRGRGKRRK